MDQLIVNAIGPDRPGIVCQVTGHLHDAGANILDSRMVNLRGQFAIILLIEAAPDHLAEIRQTLPALAEKMALRLTLTDARTLTTHAKDLPFRLKTYSM